MNRMATKLALRRSGAGKFARSAGEGFTLLELLAVMTFIAFLIAMLLPIPRGTGSLDLY